MTNGNESNDYASSIEFAKHIAMMAITELGMKYNLVNETNKIYLRQ